MHRWLYLLLVDIVVGIENFVGYKAHPIMEAVDKSSEFSFGRAKPMNDENSPVLRIKPKNGPEMTVPRGIFHYSDIERNFGSDFRLPAMNNPMDFTGTMKTKDNYVSRFIGSRSKRGDSRDSPFRNVIFLKNFKKQPYLRLPTAGITVPRLFLIFISRKIAFFLYRVGFLYSYENFSFYCQFARFF